VLALGAGEVQMVALLLLCATLALMGVLVQRSSAAQAATELLAAQLADADEERTAAAALAERTRIARDLHDVLAQSLSGLAIQLEAARRIAGRDAASEQLRGLLDQSAELARDGLSEARRAVAALRGQAASGVEQLPGLVQRYRRDLMLDAHLAVSGTRRALSAAADEALLRGAQEALTNAARYARGSLITVSLSYEDASTVLAVRDAPRAESQSAERELSAVQIAGSGLGLRGMTERITQVGGTVQAGPDGAGWLVRMEVPE
jgi:signal transduction histidine kinase